MLKFRANKKRDREESEQGERTLIMWMCWVLLMVVESQKRVFKCASTLLSHTKSDQQWHKQQHRYTNLWFLFSFFGEWMFVRNNISNTHLKHKESRKKTLIICSTSKFQNSMIFFVLVGTMSSIIVAIIIIIVYALRQLTANTHTRACMRPRVCSLTLNDFWQN